MSYTYAEKKQGKSNAAKKDPAAAPSFEALRSGSAKPTSEQMGHRVDLPDAMRAKMENAFGADLSAVKLYESDAVEAAGAEAVAQGANIVFAPGMLDFSSFGGQALLGHEISHVVSQARGEVSGGGFLNDHALEARADREGAMAAAGQQVSIPSAAISTVSAASAAGPMQAKKPWQKQRNAAPAPAPRDNTPASPEWAALSSASASGDQNAIASAYDTIAQQQRAAVTADQHTALNDYIADSRPLNTLLRSGTTGDAGNDAAYRRTIGHIDSALDQNRIGADMTTYRGVSDKALIPLLQNSGVRALRKAVKKDGTIDHKQLAKHIGKLQGLEFTDSGFGSTSVQESYAEKWRSGIVDREADTALTEQAWAEHKDDPMIQGLVQEALQRNNVQSFSDLDLTEQRFLQDSTMSFFAGRQMGANREAFREKMGSHMYQISVPKGSKASLIDRMRIDNNGQESSAGQAEMLIGRNARYRINGVQSIIGEDGKALPNQYRLMMELLSDED